MELEPFWHHFWTFSFFHIFQPKIIFFSIGCFIENFPQFAPRGEVFCDHHFLKLISAPEIDHKISHFQTQFAHNFLSNSRRQLLRPHFESARLACYYTRFWEKSKDPKYHHPPNNPFTHPPTNPSGQRAPIGAVGAGLSLDPEGRKRLPVLGSSFALKKRKLIRS